jgi:hypothetical protein
VKKWQSEPGILPARKGDAVAAGTGAIAGVSGVVYGVSAETKVLSGIRRWEGFATGGAFFFLPLWIPKRRERVVKRC